MKVHHLFLLIIVCFMRISTLNAQEFSSLSSEEVKPSMPIRVFGSLENALDEGKFEFAEEFLKDSVNHYRYSGDPLILYFCDGLKNSPSIIQFLIDHGVNKEFYSEALFLSAESNDYESVEILLNAGADINYEKQGKNALCVTTDLETAKVLIENGINTDNSELKSVLPSNFIAMQAMVEQGIQISMTPEEMGYGLHQAALIGNEWIVDYLLKRGADPDCIVKTSTYPNKDKRYKLDDELLTPLMANAIQGYARCSYSYNISGSIARMLIAGGASVNLADRNGLTALHYASGPNGCRASVNPIPMGNRRERMTGLHIDPAMPPPQSKDNIIRVLLEAGADINSYTLDRKTPLMLAVMAKNQSATKILLEAGADTSIKDSDGSTVFNLINDPDMMLIMLRGGFKNKISKEKLNKSLIQLFDDYLIDIKKVAEILDYGADINSTFRNGGNVITETLRTVYPGALESSRPLLEFLLERGANINYQNKDRETALIRCSQKETSPNDVIEYLLDKGADPDLRDKRGNTALFYAVSNNNSVLVQLLLNHGVSINIKNYNSVTALTIAKAKGFNEVAQLLENAGLKRSMEDEWWYTVNKLYSDQAYEYLGYLIDEGMDMNALSPYVMDKNWTSELPKGITALMYFAMMRKVKAIQFMIERGVDVNVRNKKGQTALDYARGPSHYSRVADVAGLLLDAGAIE